MYEKVIVNTTSVSQSIALSKTLIKAGYSYKKEGSFYSVYVKEKNNDRVSVTVIDTHSKKCMGYLRNNKWASPFIKTI